MFNFSVVLIAYMCHSKYRCVLVNITAEYRTQLNEVYSVERALFVERLPGIS